MPPWCGLLGRVDKRLQPQASGGEVEEALEGEDGLVGAGGDTALLLELAEHALDAVAVPIAAIVGMLGRLAVRTGWDNRQDAPDQQAFPEAITVVAFVRQQRLWCSDGARVGYAVVYAQAKQLVREWTSDDVKKALEPESLSLAADGWRDAVSGAYRRLSRRFGTGKAVEDDDAIAA